MGDEKVRYLADHPQYRGLRLARGNDPRIPLSVCAMCTHKFDNRSWWQKLLRRLEPVDLLCLQHPNDATFDPVTGEPSFIWACCEECGEEEIVDTPFERCLVVNPHGNCEHFEIRT